MRFRTPWNTVIEAGVAIGDREESRKREREAKYGMSLRTADYVDVAAKAQELGCRVPVGVALLPGNFASARTAAELRYHEAAPNVRSAWRCVGLIDAGPNLMPEQALARGPDATGTDLPLVVFFGSGLRSGPAGLVTLALGSVASVLSLHPGRANPRDIRLDAVVEKPDGGGYACYEYRGDSYGLLAIGGTVWVTLTGNGGADTDGYDNRGAR